MRGRRRRPPAAPVVAVRQTRQPPSPRKAVRSERSEGKSPIWGRTKQVKNKKCEPDEAHTFHVHSAWAPTNIQPRRCHAFVPVPPRCRGCSEVGCQGDCASRAETAPPAQALVPSSGEAPPAGASSDDDNVQRRDRRPIKWPPTKFSNPVGVREVDHVIENGRHRMTRRRPMSATSSSAQQVVYYTGQYGDLLIRSRAVVSARNGLLNAPEPEPPQAPWPQFDREQLLTRVKWRYGDDWHTLSRHEQARALDQEHALARLPSHVRNRAYYAGGRSLRRGDGPTPPVSPCPSQMESTPDDRPTEQDESTPEPRSDTAQTRFVSWNDYWAKVTEQSSTNINCDAETKPRPGPGPEPEPEPKPKPTLNSKCKPLNAQMGQSADSLDEVGVTAWIGGLPHALASDEAAVHTLLGQFGELESLTVRVKDGDYKSWCLASFVNEDAIERLQEQPIRVPLEPGHKFEPQEALMPWPDHKSERAGAAPERAMTQVSADNPPSLVIKQADVKGHLAKKKERGEVGGALAGQAEEHRRKRQNIRERMMTQMTDSDKAVLGRQIAAETTTKSTRQRSRMKLKDFRRSANNGSGDSEMHRSVQEMAKSSDSKVSMATVCGWLARSGDTTGSASSMSRSRDMMRSGDTTGSRSSMSRSRDMKRSGDTTGSASSMSRSRDMMRSGDSTGSASSMSRSRDMMRSERWLKQAPRLP